MQSFSKRIRACREYKVLCATPKALPSVAKELGVLRSTQSGGAKLPQTIKLKKLKLTKYSCLGIYKIF